MRILAVIQGEYGQRHVDNIRAHAPAGWTVEVWKAPPVLPPVIDYPEDYLPDSLPEVDLILALGEHPGVAELIPEIAQMTGARAVIAPIDNVAWLPRGLANQLQKWLEQIGVESVFPKPFCSLTESDYNVRQYRVAYDSALISEFARCFGRPELRITVDAETRCIAAVEVVRDATCGCARFVAKGLVGVAVDEAEYEAGLLHHHYPCLASMGKDADFGDTLMHVSGNLLKENVGEQVKPFKEIVYFTPAGRSE
ncbi:MAG: DUF166 domain-containing protein [Anaerolineae bacterium]